MLLEGVNLEWFSSERKKNVCYTFSWTPLHSYSTLNTVQSSSRRGTESSFMMMVAEEIFPKIKEGQFTLDLEELRGSVRQTAQWVLCSLKIQRSLTDLRKWTKLKPNNLITASSI